MDATTIERAIQQLKQNIINSMHHGTLFQHLGEPILLERQLFFLLLPKLNGEAWQANVETAALSVGIVHASLAEHAKINEQEITKEQQLTVLSGDYYSGRYYQILAHAGDIKMIKALSNAIVERSEKTVQVLELQTTTLEQWLEAITTIEVALIEAFYERYDFAKYKALMLDTLTAARLIEILAMMRTGQAKYVPPFVTAPKIEWLLAQLLPSIEQKVKSLSIDEQLQLKICEFVR